MGCSNSHHAPVVQRPTTGVKPPPTADKRIALQVHSVRPLTGAHPPVHPTTQLYGIKSQRGDMPLKRSSTGVQLINVMPGVQSMRLNTGGARPHTSTQSVDFGNGLQSRKGNNTLLSDAALDVLRSTAREDAATQQLDTSQGGLNYCDPVVFTGRMQDTFAYYSKNSECIGKRWLSLLATDCVNYTYCTLRDQLKRKHTGWSADKLNREFTAQIPKYLPGAAHAESVEIAEHYLKSELKLHDGAVSRDQFFLNFTRLHGLLFSCKEVTVEREQLIEKLNKQYAARQKQYIESLKNPPKHGNKENSVVSRRSSNRRRSQRESSNMFDMNDSLLQSPSSMQPVTEADEQDRQSTRRRSKRNSRRKGSDG